MDFLKRFFFYIFIILLVASIFKDLSLGIETTDEQTHEVSVLTNENFTIKKIKVSNGDTVLSIVEEINQGIEQHLEIQQILTDFKKLNPEVDPYHLLPDTFYYFPHYNYKGD